MGIKKIEITIYDFQKCENIEQIYKNREKNSGIKKVLCVGCLIFTILSFFILFSPEYPYKYI
jgi:hypothetical protein